MLNFFSLVKSLRPECCYSSWLTPKQFEFSWFTLEVFCDPQKNTPTLMYAFPSNDTHVGLDFSIHIILHYIFFIPFQLCDISLRAGVTTLSAHRVVLAAASPYFHAMFNGKLFFRENT